MWVKKIQNKTQFAKFAIEKSIKRLSAVDLVIRLTKPKTGNKKIYICKE